MQFVYNSNVFGACIIHILHTGVLKLKKLFRRQKAILLFEYPPFLSPPLVFHEVVLLDPTN